MDVAQQKMIYSTNEWRVVSYQMKVRAGFRCENCSSLGRLQTHHKYPLSRMVYGDVRAFDPNNLRVLCVPCHKNAHRFKPQTTGRREWQEMVNALTK